MFSNKKPIFSQCSLLHFEKTGTFCIFPSMALGREQPFFYRSINKQSLFEKSQLVLCKNINFFLKNKISLKNLCVGGVLYLIQTFLCPHSNACLNAFHNIHSLAIFRRFQTLSSPWWYNHTKNKKEALKTPLFPLWYAYFSHLKYILVLSVIFGKIRAPTENVSQNLFFQKIACISAI